MKAGIYLGKEQVEIQELPMPEVGDNDVLVQNLYSSICGTDDERGQIEIHLPEQMPEAFVCNCDLTAGLLMLELEKRGISVPEDVSVVGFDNYLYPGFQDLKITSYEINTKAMVKVALEKALKQIRGAASGKNMEIVSGQLVPKESVKL